jgi:hypothetical protein
MLVLPFWGAPLLRIGPAGAITPAGLFRWHPEPERHGNYRVVLEEDLPKLRRALQELGHLPAK